MHAREPAKVDALGADGVTAAVFRTSSAKGTRDLKGPFPAKLMIPYDADWFPFYFYFFFCNNNAWTTAHNPLPSAPLKIRSKSRCSLQRWFGWLGDLGFASARSNSQRRPKRAPPMMIHSITQREGRCSLVWMEGGRLPEVAGAVDRGTCPRIVKKAPTTNNGHLPTNQWILVLINPLQNVDISLSPPCPSFHGQRLGTTQDGH